MKNTAKLILFVLSAVICPGAAFGASLPARCLAPELSVTINKPVPDTVFSPGSQLLIDGRIWLPGGVASSGKCAKLAFFIAPDNDIAFADCLGRPAGLCDDVPATCPVPAVCGSASDAATFTIIEDPAKNVVKIGELAIADSVGSINSGDYSVEFSQNLTLPKNLALRGLVRFYVQYNGVVADISGEYRALWLAAYQKAIIGGETASQRIPEVFGGNAVQSDYCASSGPAAILYWSWSDPESLVQAAYRLQISERSDFSRLVHDSGKISSSNTNYATPGGKLSWGKRYYWRVKAWNGGDTGSNWSGGIPFDTPLHPYPKVNFIWTPKIPMAGDEVEFIDESDVYGASVKARWLWSFGGGDPAISYERGARAVFKEKGIKNISLSVTDSDGYTCSAAHLMQTDAKP